MTVHLSAFEVLASREVSALGAHPQRTKSHTIELPLLAGTVFGGSVGQPAGMIHPSAVMTANGLGVDSPWQHVFGFAYDDGGNYAAIEASADFARWAIEGGHQSNGGSDAISMRTAAPNSRLSGELQLVFAGNAAAALSAILTGNILGVQIVAHEAYPRIRTYHGLLHFCEFENSPPSSLANAYRIREILASLETAPARTTLGVDGAGASIYANDCGFAANSPDGILWCLPADRGNDPDQIPANVDDNTASRFRCHPSVFLRRCQYYRHVSRQAWDPIAINTTNQEQPIAIGEIEEALADSDWLIVVDGSAHIVRLPHPVGSDLRRPRDIWNQVWVPIIAGSQTPSLAPVFEGLQAQTTAGSIGDRLRYLQYARMIGLGSSFQVTYDPQGNTSPA